MYNVYLLTELENNNANGYQSKQHWLKNTSRQTMAKEARLGHYMRTFLRISPQITTILSLVAYQTP